MKLIMDQLNGLRIGNKLSNSNFKNYSIRITWKEIELSCVGRNLWNLLQRPCSAYNGDWPKVTL